MSWIDISIIALIVLLGLVGVFKGFKKSVLALGAFLIAFLLAFFLANVIAEALLGIEGVKTFVLGNGFGEKSDFSLAKWIYGSLGDGNYSPFLLENFYKPIAEIIDKANIVGVDAAQGTALYLAFIMFSAICGVGIFMIARLLLVIVTVIIKSYIGKKKSPLSRLSGFVLGAARGALWAFAITLVFSCFGGLTFMPAFGYVEAEYEHKSAVFCQHFNKGAYYIRNKLFLPDKDMYGRLVELVFKKENTDDPDAEKLTGARLELFINLSNLNYENQPWIIDQSTQKRVFDENNANPYKAADFAEVGFDRAIQAILDYNAQAAAFVDDEVNFTETTETEFKAYNDIIQTKANSVYAKTNALFTALRGYKTDYEYGKTLTETQAIETWNNTTLSNDYNNIRNIINDIADLYNGIEVFDEYPDLTDLIPERVSAGNNGQ
ncbi:CvpA family protein [Anaerocaecibacter muris]|uniref:CvpA family protein n=1 Tax=Anaerocaecibacter muris TaxID=2941513 RepID=UPI003F692618